MTDPVVDDYFVAADEHLRNLTRRAEEESREQEQKKRALEEFLCAHQDTVRHVVFRRTAESSSAARNGDTDAVGEEQEEEEDNVRELYLVGTAHVSSASAREVEELIGLVEPDTILLELCARRQGILHLSESVQEWLAEPAPPLADYVKALKNPTVFWSMCLSRLYREVATLIGSVPGAEFRAAARAGLKVGSAVLLIDRPVDLTLGRMWFTLSFWEKLKLLGVLVYALCSLRVTEAEIEAMKNADVVQELLDLGSRYFPNFIETLLNERDLVMSWKIQQSHGKRMVAVVGLAHAVGISKLVGATIPQSSLVTAVTLPVVDARATNLKVAAAVVAIVVAVLALVIFVVYTLGSFLWSLFW